MERLKQMWQAMPTRQKYMVIGVVVAVAAAIMGGAYFVGKADMVPLFTNLETKDASAINAKLKEMKVPYEISGDGKTILVSSKNVYQLRLELATSGIPAGNDKGFEIFEQNKFGVTEFQNKVNYLQAIQGELQKTIQIMPEVEDCRIHIVMPEDSLYKKEEKDATASVMLKLRAGSKLTKEQVRGIVNLVTHGVPRLKTENVTVVDSDANILNEQVDPLFAGTGSTTQIEMTQKMQDKYQKDIQSLLEKVLGPGKSAVRVNLELSFDQRTTDKQTYSPVVDDKGIVRSSQETSENYKGSANSQGGVPGVTTNVPGANQGGVQGVPPNLPGAANQQRTNNPNVPGYPAQTGNGQASNYEKKDVTKNYEVNEVKEKIIATPGSIKRLTVAVLLDSSIDKAQQDSLMKTVSSAVGISQTRGDSLSVEAIPFNTDFLDKQKAEEADKQRKEQISMLIKVGIGVGGVLVILYAIKLYLKSRQRESELAMLAAMEAPEPEPEVVDDGLTEKERDEIRLREETVKWAMSQPESVAQLLKIWLQDE